MSPAIHPCLAALVSLLAAFPAGAAGTGTAPNLDALAERYVRLVLAIGEHDPDFVDAYYGPPQWRDDARAQKRSLADLDTDATRLEGSLQEAHTVDDQSSLRARALRQQLSSIRTRLAILQGERLPFDEEARRIYGVSPPRHDDAFYDGILRQVDALLPGDGPLPDRMDAFRKRFALPDDRVRTAMSIALQACRDTTRAHVPLPDSENFRLEYVTDKPWAAYNWYRGDYQSVIEVNTSLPIYANSVAALMCHEGYPGHHAQNVLIEERLVRSRGWIEYSVYPLFSSQSLIAEGTANFGLDLVFPGDSKWQWERDHVYPLAGIDPALAPVRQKLTELSKSLAFAQIDAARAYLDGTRSAEATVAWLQKFALSNEQQARQSLRFYEKYRSYVVGYKLGEDLARRYVDRLGGSDPGARWNAFVQLLVTPPVVSDLVRGTDLDPAGP